ncbi:unnamed protein product, partial [marine sediment metagenome]
SKGIEVVTHPFTWQKYNLEKEKWDTLLLYLRKRGYKANFPGIGFHVHTTKAAWGNSQIHRLLKFIYGNKSFILQIAQREPNQYCVMDNKDFDEAVLVAKDKKNRSRDHYSTVNLNNGTGQSSETVEFRMFQGTLEPFYLHKNMEFVHACWNFTREYVHTDVRAFNIFVGAHKKMYPCLFEFMKGV